MNPMKSLACLGGAPAFPEKLHVGRPNVGNRERFLELVGEIFDRRWFSNNGECVREFERRMCALLGVRHCIPVCNATVGLEVAIRALGLRGEVIIPSFTFIATAHALQWQEITPIFCDVDPLTHNLDPARVEQLITPRTTGIIGVHLWGRACDTEALAAIAKRHSLRLLFDAAHAFGCSHHGTMIGNFGDAEVFSFHATKFMNTFEGGAIATNDDALAARIRLMINFGFSGLDNVIDIGTNGKMNEVCAAMGITGMENLEPFIATNLINFRAYEAELRGVPGLEFMPLPENERFNAQYVILEVDETRFGLSRDELLRVLHADNVLARRYFYPGCHRQQPYISLYPNTGQLLPETERLCTRVLALPTGTSIGAEEIDRVGSIIRTAQARAAEIHQHFQSA
ncbi:MAG: dTDP-4-dehydro-6-deoxyglucose aminotransferase [Chthoniobacteraceae bacterium]|nr:dTDP-4-dehydro-6-deoxyglucose aminotransferase [Chthoniobacteraceae bacterium]